MPTQKKAHILIPILLFMLNCRPLCLVKPPDERDSRVRWFGGTIQLEGDFAWERKTSYTGTLTFVEPVDLSTLLNCQECKTLASRLEEMYKTEWTSRFSTQVKSLKVVEDKSVAEFVASIKVAKVNEIHAFWKLPVSFLRNNDRYEIWFKIVDKKNNSIVFAARRPDFISCKKDIANQATYFAGLVDNFKRNGSE